MFRCDPVLFSHIASATGALIESYRYDLYGKPRVYDSGGNYQQNAIPVAQDLGNGGSRWIPQLGLYDDRNRFMSPDLGRFLQPDPIGFKGDASNLYRYCGNDWANRTDPTGLYFGVDDAIAAGIGAAIGLAGQGLEDAFSGHLSGWQAYSGAAVGGALGGWSSEYVGPVVGAAIGSATANATKQGLNIASGTQQKFNTGELAVQTGIGMVASKVPAPKIVGVNAGRNSYSAIAKQMETKLQNGTIQNVTAKTAAKAAVPGAANEVAHQTAEATMNATARSVEANSSQSGTSSQNFTGHTTFGAGFDRNTGMRNTPLLMNGKPQVVPTPPPTPTTSDRIEQSR